MARQETWCTADMRSFLVEYGVPTFLQGVAVRSIVIDSQSSAEWRCSMCGTPNRSVSKCDGCNAPRKEMLTRGIASIEGFLPHSLCLDELDKEFQIDICYKDCGIPSEYIEEYVVISLRDCRVLRKWIPAIEVLYNEEYQALTLCLEVGCDVVLRDVRQ